MKARELRYRHFKSSVGSMLNENHGSGMTAESVKNEDYVYIPNMPLPWSNSAFNFLDKKFPESPVQRARPASSSDSLYKAYLKATGQPQMVVHYDRDPLFWESKKIPTELENIGGDSESMSSAQEKYLMDNYGRHGLVPSDVAPVNTPATVSSAVSSRKSHQSSSHGVVNNGGSRNASSMSKKRYSSCSDRQGGSLTSRASTGKLEDNRHRLWSPGSEAAGFKPYSPFSDSLFDFGKKEAKFIPPETTDPVLRTSDHIQAPRYYDACKEMLDINGKGAGTADILKVHGNPEYPSKVMDERDVPNYIAWAQIYPYCPLSQVEGKEKPVYVPPRGFTPSTAAKPPTPAKTRDVAKVKENIVAGIKPPSSTSSMLKGRGRRAQRTPLIPVFRQPSLSSKLQQHQLKLQQSEQQQRQQQHEQQQEQRSLAKSEPALPTNSDLFDETVSRRVLEMKMKAPNVWYSGQTPTHTPTPDYTLPIRPSKAWISHYSPARVRHFLRAAAPNAS